MQKSIKDPKFQKVVPNTARVIYSSLPEYSNNMKQYIKCVKNYFNNKHNQFKKKIVLYTLYTYINRVHCPIVCIINKFIA